VQEIKANLYPCMHCSETGVCTTGNDSTSCQACVKYHELKKHQKYTGLACGTCGGLGQSEPTTERLNKRTKPLLAMGIVFMLLLFTFILGILKNPHFSEFLVFAGTLIGSITTFYFSNSKST
jgi:hypothetical protein